MSDQVVPQEPFAAAIASAIRESEYQHLLKHLEEKTFDAQQFRAFHMSLGAESDRALAIISFSYADEKLKDLMLQALNPNIPDSPERLFEPLGPLSSASARIKLAGALDWIALPVYRSLEAHRKIRNEFAHDPFTPGFGDPKVASLVKNMEPYERHFLHLFEEKRLDPSALNTRFLFRVRAMMTCHQMITELMVAPLAIRFGIEPFRFLDQTSDGRSRALQELTEAAGVVLADLTESEVTMTGSGADG